MKFKKGDKVIRLTENKPFMKVGVRFTVEEAYEERGKDKLKLVELNDEHKSGWWAERFELDKESKVIQLLKAVDEL